jgi:hypothetical protein
MATKWTDTSPAPVANSENGCSDELPSSLLEIAMSPPCLPVDGIVVGRVVEIREAVYVSFPGCLDPRGVEARCLVRLEPRDHGAEVALLFELGDPTRPCVIGRMASHAEAKPPIPEVHVRHDAECLVLRAEHEIVLQCGEASITLTRAGKVLIRGEYVLSASTGVHRILGGSVEIN